MKTITEVYYPTSAWIANLLASIASIAGSIYIYSHLSKRPFITAGLKMVFFVAVADTIFAVANIMTLFSYKNTDMCWLEGSLR